MKALVWHGKHDIRCESVPDPKIEQGRDAIIKVTSCAICGSDLHLYDGFMSGMQSGDIMGHEFMGEVMEVGRDNKKLKVGDRVVVPFTICCGECEQCKRSNFSVCERTNRNGALAKKMFGHTTAGLFGYTHLTGGFPGGQAEYVRVPYADVGPVVIPDGRPPSNATLSQPIQSRFGERGRSASSPPSPLRCRAPSRSSSSTTCRSAWKWRRGRAR
jgi:threonine dehydrogenase-like Zn-dependent dehydrogenase